MCTYNDASLLKDAIHSVKMQDCQNWELIVLDNSDRSREPWAILEEESRADSRIKVYQSERNVGWAKGAAECLKYARGKYMTFLAADDMLTEGALRRVLDAAAGNEPDIVWIGLEIAEHQPDGTTQSWVFGGESRHFNSAGRVSSVYYLMQNIYYNSFCHFERIKFLKEEGIDFFEPYYADCGGMTRAMVRAKSMVVVPEAGYRLRTDTSQTRGCYIMGAYPAMFVSQWQSIRECLEQEGCKDEAIWNYMAERIGRNLLGNIRKLSDGCDCRDCYMNPVNCTWEDRLLEVQSMLTNPVLMDMCARMGEKFAAQIEAAVKRLCSHIRENPSKL